MLSEQSCMKNKNVKPSSNLSTSAFSKLEAANVYIKSVNAKIPAACFYMGVPIGSSSSPLPGDHPPLPGHSCRVVSVVVYWSPRRGPFPKTSSTKEKGGPLGWPFPYMFSLLVSFLLQPLGVPCRSGEPACHCSSLSKFASNMGFKYARCSSTNVLSVKGAPCIQATSKTTASTDGIVKVLLPSKRRTWPCSSFSAAHSQASAITRDQVIESFLS